jgi:septum formation protein
MTICRPIILASQSPRRLQLLKQIAIAADVMVSDIDETALAGEQAQAYVERLAVAKARVVATLRPDAIVLAADTIVVCDGQILGKPLSRDDAFSMWRQLSNREHEVYTAMAMIHSGQLQQSLSVSKVEFAEISEQAMALYWATGEPMDKAGGYAIQGLAAQWIKEIRGSYSAIMGLDLYACSSMLQRAGVASLQ